MDEVVTFTRIVPATETMFFIPAFPLSGASIDLYFSTSQYYDSGAGGSGQPVTNYLSISRASSGYAKTIAGTLTSFGVNILRITDLGLLVEDARTNGLVRSAELSDASWTAGFTTVNADVAVSPDGTTTADSLIPGVGNNEHTIFQAYVNAAGTYTWSIYMKPFGYNFGSINAIDAAGNRSCAVFNLTTGAVTATSTSGAPAAATTFSEILGNGWVRLGLSLASGGTSFMQCAVSDTGTPAFGGGNNPTFAGDGSSGIYAWGAQVEAGDFPSSYISTTNVAVTRATDAISCLGSLSTLLTTAAFSTVISCLASASIVATRGLIGWDGNSGRVRTAGANTQFGAVNSTATTELFANMPSGNWQNTDFKVGFSTNDASPARSLVANGGTVATDAVSQSAAAPVSIGSFGGFTPNIYIRRLTTWNSKLADATLQGFTA